MNDHPTENAPEQDQAESRPTIQMLRDYYLSLSILDGRRPLLTKGDMARVIRGMEAVAAISLGASVDEIRQIKLTAASEIEGVPLTSDEFEAVYIEGTAEIVGGVVVDLPDGPSPKRRP